MIHVTYAHGKAVAYHVFLDGKFLGTREKFQDAYDLLKGYES